LKGGFLSRKFFLMANHEINFNRAYHSKKMMLAYGITFAEDISQYLGEKHLKNAVDRWKNRGTDSPKSPLIHSVGHHFGEINDLYLAALFLGYGPGSLSQVILAGRAA
jgi:hypothetical protein